MVNAHVLEFVRDLTHEHELGLSSVIQARIEAIRGATETLTAGIEAGDTGQQTQAINRLSTLFRDISRQLEQDRHVIAELAEQAKSADTRAPIAKRYKSVLDAYDQYFYQEPEELLEMLEALKLSGKALEQEAVFLVTTDR